MAQLSKSHPPVRAIVMGYPGSGKTGALSCLADAGWNLRILDFDGNLDPLFQYTTPEGLARIDAIACEDKLRAGAKFIEPEGIPTAFETALKALDRWKYKDEDGNEYDLGRSKEWGPDTIVVIDSLTSMGLAAKRRMMALMNKTPMNTTQAVWGNAMNEQEALIEKLTSQRNRFHVIVLSHLKLIGPKDIQATDDDLTKQLKERVADVVPTRLYPSALGQALPPLISSHFPIAIRAEQRMKMAKSTRVLRTEGGEEIDLKVPSPKIKGDLPLEDGLLTIFRAMGHEPPRPEGADA